MENVVSKPALIKRLRRALGHWNWYLVVARGHTNQSHQHLGSYYVIDADGNVMGHHYDLVDLTKQQQVLRAGETMEGCEIPPSKGRGTTVAQELPDSLASEAAKFPPAAIDHAAVCEASASLDRHQWKGLRDDQGHMWVGWPIRRKAPFSCQGSAPERSTPLQGIGSACRYLRNVIFSLHEATRTRDHDQRQETRLHHRQPAPYPGEPGPRS